MRQLANDSPSHLVDLFVAVHQHGHVNPLMIQLARQQTVRQTPQEILRTDYVRIQ